MDEFDEFKEKLRIEIVATRVAIAVFVILLSLAVLTMYYGIFTPDIAWQFRVAIIVTATISTLVQIGYVHSLIADIGVLKKLLDMDEDL